MLLYTKVTSLSIIVIIKIIIIRSNTVTILWLNHDPGLQKELEQSALMHQGDKEKLKIVTSDQFNTLGIYITFTFPTFLLSRHKNLNQYKIH